MDFYSRENRMKKILFIVSLVTCHLSLVTVANAARDAQFKREVRDGLDMYVAQRDGAQLAAADKSVAPGELGSEVYQTAGNVPDESANLSMFIPTDMYMRAGAGYNMGFISGGPSSRGTRYELENSYAVQLGVGMNLSSYVRAEFDFQSWRYGFKDVPDVNADARSGAANLYFDLARRYVRRGDLHIRRTFVPFIGFGLGAGEYRFQMGESGAFLAPRTMAGVNIMLTDLFGIDLTYQYQMFMSHGFGWNASGGVRNLNDIMLTARMNF